MYDALLRKISKISKYQHTNTQIRKFKWKVLWDLRYYAESWKVTKQDKYQEKYECLGLIRGTLWISMEYSRGNSYTVIKSHLTWMLSILVLKNKKKLWTECIGLIPSNFFFNLINLLCTFCILNVIFNILVTLDSQKTSSSIY